MRKSAYEEICVWAYVVICVRLVFFSSFSYGVNSTYYLGPDWRTDHCYHSLEKSNNQLLPLLHNSGLTLMLQELCFSLTDFHLKCFQQNKKCNMCCVRKTLWTVLNTALILADKLQSIKTLLLPIPRWQKMAKFSIKLTRPQCLILYSKAHTI